MNFTRREILAAFLGTPIALSACKQGPSTEYFPSGEIIGASDNIGHLMREHARREVPAANWETKKLAIIGGGAAGLSAAWKLQKEGFRDFALLELEPVIGGTAQSGKNGVSAYPWGAHYLPVPFKENTELVSLLDEMQLSEGRDANGEVVIAEQYLCREPEERIFYKGRWYEGLYLRAGASDEDLRQFAEFQKLIDGWVNWRDSKGRRAFTLPVAECSNDAEALALDKISFADWLKQKGFNSPRLNWYCDYATRDDYGLKLEQTSAWAGLFYFCARVRKSGEESQPFITFPEGNGRFIAHLHSKVSEQSRTRTVALDIAPTEKGVDVTYLNTGTNEIRGFRCERVLFTAPVFTRKYLIRDFREQPPVYANSFDHNAWFVANLTLKDRPQNKFPKDFPMAWDNVLYESPSLGYVTATHQKGVDHGATVLTYYFPMCEKDGRAKLFAYGWRDLADICLTDLEQAHKNIRLVTEKIDIMRWGHAMISPRPDFMWSGVREQAAKPYRNIHFAHSDLSGIALFEEAFYHGIRAAKELLAVFRTG